MNLNLIVIEVFSSCLWNDECNLVAEYWSSQDVAYSLERNMLSYHALDVVEWSMVNAIDLPRFSFS